MGTSGEDDEIDGSKGLTFRAIADGMTKQGRPMTAATVYRIVSGKREVDGLTSTA
jgi:hypothetical protein